MFEDMKKHEPMVDCRCKPCTQHYMWEFTALMKLNAVCLHDKMRVTARSAFLLHLIPMQRCPDCDELVPAKDIVIEKVK